MKMNFRVRSEMLGDDLTIITEVENAVDKVWKEFSRAMANLQEEAIRESLIKLGWTPPPEQSDDSWPQIGETYVWEMDKPHAAMGVIVTDIQPILGRVCARRIAPGGGPDARDPVGVWNDLDRFREACTAYREYKREHGDDHEG